MNLTIYYVGGRLGWNGFPGRGLHGYVVVATVLLIWLEEIPVQIPTVLVQAIDAVAAASLFIYLTHIAFKDIVQGIWSRLAGAGWPPFPLLLTVPIAMERGYFVWRISEFGMRSLRVRMGRGGAAEPAPAAGFW